MNRIVFFVLLLAYVNAQAESSFKYDKGVFKDSWIGFAVDSKNIRFANNRGDYSSFEFTWDNKDYVSLIGDINVDSNNNIRDYVLGLGFGDKDLLAIHQFTLSDQLIDISTTPSVIVDTFSSKLFEVRYEHKLDWVNFYTPSAYVSYTKSSLPTIEDVNTADWMIDLNPDSTMYNVGFKFDSLKTLLNDKETGFNFYAMMDGSIGYITRTYSNKVYHTESPLIQ